MNGDFSRSWMWSEACEMLARAERLHREFFRPIRAVSRLAAWVMIKSLTRTKVINYCCRVSGGRASVPSHESSTCHLSTSCISRGTGKPSARRHGGAGALRASRPRDLPLWYRPGAGINRDVRHARDRYDT